MVRIFSTGSWDVSRRDFDGKSPTGVSDLTSEGCQTLPTFIQATGSIDNSGGHQHDFQKDDISARLTEWLTNTVVLLCVYDGLSGRLIILIRHPFKTPWLLQVLLRANQLEDDNKIKKRRRTVTTSKYFH